MSRKRPQPPVKPFKKKPNPLKAAKVTEIDYKDRCPAAQVHLRSRQDSFPSYHRRDRAGAA